ncbi:MAG: inositol monophosphatase family protein [Dehalococcoidia bacterium]|nr:inositol monophosphatase family protein [Dehalococcoidia bacterium]MDD5494689.1 inositol monophosphatase family protein [Dehalococcoidia bacterium]
MPDKTAGILPVSSHGKSPAEVARFAAREAGKILLDRLHKRNGVHIKGRRNIVTEADLAAEKCILEIIRKEFPQHGILAEEHGADGSQADYIWVIDPLDGTNNYFLGIPYFCVNIALSKKNEVVLGVTYDPVRDELFFAQRGKGASLNNRAISVSGVATLHETVVGVDLGYRPERSAEILNTMSKLWPQIYCMRLIGSACLGLAYVACGRFSLYLHRYLYPWDTASGLLLINEAGGRVQNWSGRAATLKDRQIMAGNTQVLGEFKRWLKCR